MGYLNEDGLARYDDLIKSWVTLKSGTVDGIDPLLNWQKTATAGAVTFSPLPAAPIDPVVNFLFTETGPAEGTKGPDNPSTIAGVSSVTVTRCGKNQIKMPYLSQGTGSATIRDVTFKTDESTGIVTVTGTATGGDASFWLVGNTTFMRLRKNETYFLSGCPSGGSADTYLLPFTRYNLDGSYGASLPNDIGSGSSASYTEDWKPIIAIRVKDGVTVSNLVFKPQLELGSVATSFEPYAGTDYTIDLNGTYYGGSVDLSAGLMTVTHSGLSLNGDTYLSGSIFEEQADVYGVGFYPNPARLYPLANSSQAACSILPVEIGSGARNFPCAYLADNAMAIRLLLSKTSLGLGDGVDAGVVRTAVKAFLAQHPGFIVWPVATPYTVQLIPTQIYSLSQLDPYTPRLNTVYSDQTSVQVGYPKSPQATQNELTSAIVSLGGNV